MSKGEQLQRIQQLVVSLALLSGGPHGWAQDALSEPEAAASESAANQGEPAAQPEPPPYANREARDMALLAQAVPSDQVVWFDIGGERVLALYQPAISASPSGAVLLVQDQDRNPTWPERIQALRLSLPEQGWTTMVVTLPPADPVAVPERDLPVAPAADTAGEGVDDTDAYTEGERQVDDAANTAEAPRPETEEVFNDVTGEVADVASMAQEQPVETTEPEIPAIPAATRVDQRLAQAVEHLRAQGQFNLALLAEGGGALRAARLFNTMGAGGFRALVLVDASHALATETGDVVAMASADLPVLDILAVDQPSLIAAAQMRRTAAKRAGRTSYQQVRMPRYEPDLVRLSKRVRGFLDRHAKGVQVDNAQVVENPPG